MTRESIEAVRVVSRAVSVFIIGVFVGMTLWDQITDNAWRTGDWASFLGAVFTVFGAASIAYWQIWSEKKRQRNKFKQAIRCYKIILSAVEDGISKTSGSNIISELMSYEIILNKVDSNYRSTVIDLGFEFLGEESKYTDALVINVHLCLSAIRVSLESEGFKEEELEVVVRDDVLGYIRPCLNFINSIESNI